MTEQDLNNIERGAPVEYAIFKNVKLLGVCNKYVTMYDNHGDEKKVYIELFLKYGKAI
jgi:hypothetical protein